MEKMVTISERKYKMLLESSEVDTELVEKIKRSLEDVKNGRIREWKD
ncbi:MAG: hypothetical protein AABY06_02385 [Nanoarchaeota archaeon]